MNLEVIFCQHGGLLYFVKASEDHDKQGEAVLLDHHNILSSKQNL